MNNFKIILNLSPEQINDFFNMLTNEGTSEIFFNDIKGLIHFIDEKRKDNEEEIIPFNISFKNFEFLNNNIEKLSSIENSDVFRTEFMALLKKTQYDFEVWNSDIIDEIFLKFKEYFFDKKEKDSFYFLENYFLVNGSERSSNLRNRKVSQKGFQQFQFGFIDDMDYLKKQFLYFIKKFQEIKKDVLKPVFNSVFNDFIIFFEIFEDKVQSFKDTFCFYENFVRNQKSEIKNIKEIIESQKLLVSRIQTENIILRNNNENLVSEKKELENYLESLQSMYKNKQIEIKSLKEDFHQYEEDLTHSHILVNNLKEEKETLNTHIEDIRTNFDSKKELIEKNLLKDLNKKIKSTENTKKHEIKTLKTKLESMTEIIQEYKKDISFFKVNITEKEEQILNLKKEKDELQHINFNRESLRDIDTIMKTSNLQGLDVSILSNFSNEPSILSMDFGSENPSRKVSGKNDIVYSKNVIKNFSNINNIISAKKVVKKKRFVSYFRNYVYICEKKYKKLYFLDFSKNEINFYTTYNRKLFINFSIENLEAINISKNNSFLIELVYKNPKKSNSKSISLVLESPDIDHFYEALMLNKNLQKKCVSNLEYLDIENETEFNISSLNVFPNSAYKGFIRLYVNNIFYNWKITYFILIDSILLRIKFPITFYYNQTKDIFKDVYIFKLENFTVMKSKEMQKSPNIFAIKLIDEKIDLIIATPNSLTLKEWLDSFYSIFDDCN